MAQFGKASSKRGKPTYAYAIIGVSLVLFLFGLVGWFVLNLRKTGDYFKENIQVHAWLNPNAPKRNIDSLKNYIAAFPFAKGVEHVTKEMAIEKWNKDNDTTDTFDTLPAMRTARVLLAAVVLAAACDDAALAAADPDAAADALLREVQARGYREWTRPPKHEMRIATNAPHGSGVEVFVDEAMADALANLDGLGRTQWPEGGTIVLEGYAEATAGGGRAARWTGADRDHAEARRDLALGAVPGRGPRRARFAGRPDVCVGCHVGAQDFVRGFSLPRPVVDE